MTIETLDLEDFLAHKGWAWFRAQYEQEWGDGPLMGKIEGISRIVSEPGIKQSQIEQALVARVAVRGLMERPQAELQRRKEAAARMPDELSQQSRRGVGL